MPAVKSHSYANGLSKKANSLDQMDEEKFTYKMANKKLDLIEMEMRAHAQIGQTQEAEVFHDNFGQGEEPIVIYDTQNNTSIAQTAKDQFAAALLRLQSDLDASTTRLEEIEKRVDVIAAQQRQQQSIPNQDKIASKKSNWLPFPKNSHLNALIYLSWPVLVFVAMRALERRSLLRKLE